MVRRPFVAVGVCLVVACGGSSESVGGSSGGESPAFVDDQLDYDSLALGYARFGSSDCGSEVGEAAIELEADPEFASAKAADDADAAAALLDELSSGRLGFFLEGGEHVGSFEPATLVDGRRAYLATDYLVRHALPYVAEYVVSPLDREVDPELREPRRLAELAPLRDRASLGAAARALRDYVRRLRVEEDRLAGRVQTIREELVDGPEPSPDASYPDEEGGSVSPEAGLERDRNNVAELERFVVEILLPLVDGCDPPDGGRVVYAYRALIGAVAYADIIGDDTLRRAGGEALVGLRILAAGAVPLDAVAPLAFERRRRPP